MTIICCVSQYLHCVFRLCSDFHLRTLSKRPLSSVLKLDHSDNIGFCIAIGYDLFKFLHNGQVNDFVL